MRTIIDPVQHRAHLLGQLKAHKREHGTEVPFVISDVECDLLTEGNLECEGPRPHSEVAGRYRGVLIAIDGSA